MIRDIDDASIPAEPTRPRLLLIEDDWSSHSALRKIFTKLGWEVDSAMTVAGGLSMLELRPEGIILDLMLPDGDGTAVLRKARSDYPEIKVAVATGVDDPARLEAIRRLGPVTLMRKPVDLEELLRFLGVKPAS